MKQYNSWKISKDFAKCLQENNIKISPQSLATGRGLKSKISEVIISYGN